MIPARLKITLEKYIAAAYTPRETAVHVMKELQSHYGWLTDEAVAEAAQLLDLTPTQIEELATFYEMIYRRPVGKKVIHVCDSISCWAMGCESLLQKLSGHLGISLGETTKDGMFTLLPCCCLGNCGEAPTMMIGDNLYGRLTLEKALEILQQEMQEISETQPPGD